MCAFSFEADYSQIENQELVDDFVDRLAEAFGKEVDVEDVEGTYFFESDQVDISFAITDTSFEIRNIESKQKGYGKNLLLLIHDFAEDMGLEIVASNVKDKARSFWEDVMEYVEGDEGQYYKP